MWPPRIYPEGNLMPDPAEIITSVILQPPPGCPHIGSPEWQHKSAMSMPGGPALARHITEAAIQALTDAGWMIVPGWGPRATTLPSAGQVRAWLADHDWTPLEPGPAGTLWTPPGTGPQVAVPHGDGDPDVLAGAIKRIAGQAGRLAGAVAREMRQCPDE